jgi:beta-glucanase (GH16 family)
MRPPRASSGFLARAALGALAAALVACEDLPPEAGALGSVSIVPHVAARPTQPPATTAPAPVTVAATPAVASPIPPGGLDPTRPPATPTPAPTATPTPGGATPTPRPTRSPTPRPTATPSASPTPVPGAFDDPLDALVASRWAFSDGWANPAPFDCGWLADHGVFDGGQLVLSLDATPASGHPYASAELRSKARVGYGRVEARLKPAAREGVVTSFITYSGPEEETAHDEIDFEFLGKDPTKVQLNYFAGGVGGHEQLVDLGFDASAGFHDYAFDWGPDGITWYADGRAIHAVTAADGPLPSVAGKIMANLWPATGADEWAGTFTAPATPVTAAYERIAFTPR